MFGSQDLDYHEGRDISNPTPGSAVTDLQLDEDLKGRPVITTAGDDVAQVSGFARDGDDVVALTLAKTGLLGGAMDEVLPLSAIEGVGPDAVVVVSVAAFALPEDVPEGQSLQDVRVTDQPTTGGADRGPGAMLFSEARTRKVVSGANDEAVGRIDRFVVDPEARRIGSFRLDNVSDMKRYLSWRDVGTFGPERVTVSSVKVLRLGDGQREERIRRDYGLLGKRILTDAGHELGKVTDVAFDPDNGRITAVVLEDQEIPGERLLGVGPYAVVVAH